MLTFWCHNFLLIAYDYILQVECILNWVCGPRTSNLCIPGARTAYPCAHNLAAIYIAGLVARDPDAFQTTYDEINLLDCGARDHNFNEEVASAYYH